MNDFDTFSTILSLERYFYYRKVEKYLFKDKMVENRSKLFISRCHISQTILNVRTTLFRIIEVVVRGFFENQQDDFSVKSPYSFHYYLHFSKRVRGVCKTLFLCIFLFLFILLFYGLITAQASH
jgi:hypothetical protein